MNHSTPHLTPHPTPHRRRTAAQELFERDRRAGLTGMILRWQDLTPRQRAGYRKAAARGLAYSVATDELVGEQMSERAIGA